MKKLSFGYVSAFVVLGLGYGVFSSGCGGTSVAAICDLLCTCDPCTDADRKKCETDGDAARQAAEDAGCGSAFGDALSCFHDNASCKSDSAVNKACNDTFNALDTCTKGGGLFGVGDDCTQATNKLSACLNVSGSSSGNTASVACEGQTLCAAQCINAADCAAIKDAFSGMPTSTSKAFLDCTSKCATAG